MEHKKEKRWSKKKKKNSLGTNLCVIIQIKKWELSVGRVSPAYSPRCVKHELILYGSDAAVCTVFGENDQVKGSWHFKFYWLVPFRSVWTLHTHTHTHTGRNKQRNTAWQNAKQLLPFSGKHVVQDRSNNRALVPSWGLNENWLCWAKHC